MILRKSSQSLSCRPPGRWFSSSADLDRDGPEDVVDTITHGSDEQGGGFPE